MTRTTRNKDILAPTAHNLARILIASYFIAVALGIIAGTSGVVLIGLIAPAPYAEIIARGTMFGLAFLLLNGLWLRPASLLLATLLLWSSLANFISPVGTGNAEQFWRDLALIGGLFLAYSQTERRGAHKRSVFRVQRKVRKLVGDARHSVRRITPARDELDKLASVTAHAPVVTAKPRRETAATIHQLHRPERAEADIFEENIFAETDQPHAKMSVPA